MSLSLMTSYICGDLSQNFSEMLRIGLLVRKIVVAEIKLLILCEARKQRVMSESSIRIYPN